MNERLLQNLRVELAALEAELAPNPVFQRHKLIRELLQSYEANNSDQKTSSRSTPPASGAIDHTYDATSDEMRAVIYDHLRSEKSPVPTRDLVALLKDNGMMVRGENPIANLSSQLSKDARFAPQGKSGWVLDEDSQLDEEKHENLLNDFFAQLDDDPSLVEEVYDHVEKGKFGLPKEADQTLLRLSRDYFNRRLSQLEKTWLRDKVRSRINKQLCEE